jgi:signal transduction histidine kinase
MSNNEILFGVVFITLVLLLLLSGIAITFFVTIRQRLEQQMKMKHIALEYQKELREAEAEVSESVRTHIAREIHDNVGQMLTYLRLQLENKMLDDSSDELKPMQETVIDIAQQVRLLSRSLNPEYIREQTFTAVLKQETERIKQLKKLRVHWHDDGIETHLSKDQQLIAFRIFQEVVHNALKHSDARNLYVDLKGHRGFYLCVSDDGVGFDANIAAAASNGLRNIKRRSELAGLSCVIDTFPERGCTITLESIDENPKAASNSAITTEYASS